MSLQDTAAPVFPVDQSYTTCVEIELVRVLGLSTFLFSSISLPSSHPVFSADVDVLIPFSTRSGGIPLRHLPGIVTIVAHAYGVDLCAEQFEVLWQFKLFAEGICSAAFSETAKDELLTLGGTQAAPRNIIGNFTGEDHYLGWTQEHFTRFFHEYIRFSGLQLDDCVKVFTAESWRDLQMPRWLSAAELSVLCRPSESVLDRSLDDIIFAAKEESPKTKKADGRRNLADRARRGEPPKRTGQYSRVNGKRRDRAIQKETSKPFSRKSDGPATRPTDIYRKRRWYSGQRGANCHQDRLAKNGKKADLQETNVLGPAISKITRPFHSITAYFQERKSSNGKTALTESDREFIAHKIEQQMLIPGQKEAILDIIRTVSPKEHQQLRNGRLIDYRNMPDRLYVHLGRFVSDSAKQSEGRLATRTDLGLSSFCLDSTASPASAAPNGLTREMVEFTRDNVHKLPPNRMTELQFLTHKIVPSLVAAPGSDTPFEVLAEALPIENQIMIYRYVKKHMVEETSQEEEGDGIENGQRADERMGGTGPEQDAAVEARPEAMDPYAGLGANAYAGVVGPAFGYGGDDEDDFDPDLVDEGL